MALNPNVPNVSLSRNELAYLAAAGGFTRTPVPGVPGVDALTAAVALSWRESRGQTAAVNRNTNGSIDNGLVQWNNTAHPDISEGTAYNPWAAFQRMYAKTAGGTNFGAWTKDGPSNYRTREAANAAALSYATDLPGAAAAAAAPANPTAKLAGVGWTQGGGGPLSIPLPSSTASGFASGFAPTRQANVKQASWTAPASRVGLSTSERGTVDQWLAWIAPNGTAGELETLRRWGPEDNMWRISDPRPGDSTAYLDIDEDIFDKWLKHRDDWVNNDGTLNTGWLAAAKADAGHTAAARLTDLYDDALREMIRSEQNKYGGPDPGWLDQVAMVATGDADAGDIIPGYDAVTGALGAVGDALGAIVGVLTSGEWWKRIGIGALGVALVAGVVLYVSRGQIAETVTGGAAG